VQNGGSEEVKFKEMAKTIEEQAKEIAELKRLLNRE
jgi:hypothetical protein